LTSAAAGRTLKPVVVGKTRDFGLEGDTGRKLKQMREWVIPGLGKLGDFLDIHSNASGFFDTETYSRLVLSTCIGNHAKDQERNVWSLLLHDAAPTHKGRIEDKDKQPVFFPR
jgi:hypothetical protein